MVLKSSIRLKHLHTIVCQDAPPNCRSDCKSADQSAIKSLIHHIKLLTSQSQTTEVDWYDQYHSNKHLGWCAPKVVDWSESTCNYRWKTVGCVLGVSYYFLQNRSTLVWTLLKLRLNLEATAATGNRVWLIRSGSWANVVCKRPNWWSMKSRLNCSCSQRKPFECSTTVSQCQIKFWLNEVDC